VRPDQEKPKSFEREHGLGVEFEQEDERRKMETATMSVQALTDQPIS